MNTSGENVNALITGGSSGIGYSIANELARKGYNLILASNEEKQLEEVREELVENFQIEVYTCFIDLAEPGAGIKLYEWCRKQELGVEILVNNAGIFFFGEVVETNDEKVQRMLTLHTSTPAMLCTLFGRDMKKKRSGHILNISSLAAYLPYPGIALYSSTKRFLKSFSRSLRTEMIDYNVNVTCICPGAISTQLYKLDDDKRKKAIKAGVMMSSDKLAKLAVKAMFNRKSIMIPGFFNRLIIFVTSLVPQGIIVLIRRHSKFLPPDKI